MEPLYPVSVRDRHLRRLNCLYLKVSCQGTCHTTPHLFPPVTSRRPREEEKDGHNYCFVTREEMEKDIKDSRYLEHGEYDGNLYGTKIDSIHEVVDTSRTCILDVNPQVNLRHTHSVYRYFFPRGSVVTFCFLFRP